MAAKKKSIIDFQNMKKAGEKIAYLVTYDWHNAHFAEEAGMDMLLVGDSVGMSIYGYPGTVPVTMDQMIYHSEAVRRGAPNTFIIGDMPFGSYQRSPEWAVINAERFYKEAMVDAIKLEGGVRVVPQIKGDCGRRHECNGAYRPDTAVFRADGRIQGPGSYLRNRTACD